MGRIACWLGFHQLETIEELTSVKPSKLKADRCKRCGIELFYLLNPCGKLPITQSHYKDLKRIYARH